MGSGAGIAGGGATVGASRGRQQQQLNGANLAAEHSPHGMTFLVDLWDLP